MQTRKLFLVSTLVSVWITAGQLPAQTFKLLHSFAAQTPAFTNTDGIFYNNFDGASPDGDLIVSGNTLYGTAYDGGNANCGTVFAVNTDGSSFTILHRFTQRAGSSYTNSDGAKPAGALVLSGSTLYGTAAKGGSSGNGTIFAVSTAGTGFTILHQFTALASGNATNSDGAIPYAGLVLTNNILYGVTSAGGTSGKGTVFKVNTDGLDFTTLRSFSGVSDGAAPQARLVLSGNTLYGTAVDGGSSGNGTVFRLNTDGSAFTNLHSFTATSAFTNSDGANPYAGLVLSGNTLYGAAAYGGHTSDGTVFKLNTDGTGFTVLHSFTATLVAGANSDGANPVGRLVLSGNTLYGTAYFGGSSGNGTVFALNTSGSEFMTLHSFSAGSGSFPYHINSDGAYPWGGLILSGTTLHGTAQQGSSGSGTVFSLSFAPPQLTISFAGDYPVLTWPTKVPGFDYSGYHLQYSTGLNSSANWQPLAMSPTIINGRYSVTVPGTVFLTQSFAAFRLKQ